MVGMVVETPCKSLVFYYKPKSTIMKKFLIGSIVGAIIIFVWQGLSFMVIGIHEDAMKYSAGQDNIMSAISANIKEDGAYMIPSAPTKKEREELMKTLDGKPMAAIIYQSAVKIDLTRNLIRTFLVDIFLVISLIYILTRGGTPIGRRVFAASVAFGIATWIWTFYLGHIWGGLPWHMIKGDLINSIVAWGLCGIWLGWWLNRTSVKLSS
jgi:hypothetical protein